MRISDWSSDVCSSDLMCGEWLTVGDYSAWCVAKVDDWPMMPGVLPTHWRPLPASPTPHPHTDRQSVVSGKSVSVRLDPGGRRIIKKQKNRSSQIHQSPMNIRTAHTKQQAHRQQ